MAKADSVRVQEMTGQLRFRPPVDHVADQRVANGGEVHSYLVRPASLWRHPGQGVIRVAGLRGVNRDGLAVGEKPLSGLPAKAQTAWQISVGKGQGGLVLADGKLLVLHETMAGGKPMETAALINAENGKVIWQTPYAESWQ